MPNRVLDLPKFVFHGRSPALPLLLCICAAIDGNEAKAGHGEHSEHVAESTAPQHPGTEAAKASEHHAEAAPAHTPAVPEGGGHHASEHAATPSPHDSTAHAAAQTDTATHDSIHGTPSHGEPAAHPASAEAHGKHAASPHGMTTPKRPKLDSGTLAGPLPRRIFAWKADQGPLLLKSDVIVGPGQILEIGRGVEVRIAARDAEPAGVGDWTDSQYVSLIVAGGTLRILGTSAQPVRFTPLRRGSAPHWGGIRIVDTRKAAQAEIAWADIPRAHVAVDFERASGILRHVVVRDANMGIRVTGGSAPEISQSIVFRSRVAGLHSERSGPVVRGSIFVDNAGPGTRFEGVGLARLEANAFWNNTGGDVVQGPPKVGGPWTTDSIVRPDAYGNVKSDPVFRASKLHAHLLSRKRDSLRLAPIWKRRLPENPDGDGPWALSPFSPLLDRGGRSPLCRDRDGSPCDIGLWGGKD